MDQLSQKSRLFMANKLKTFCKTSPISREKKARYSSGIIEKQKLQKSTVYTYLSIFPKKLYIKNFYNLGVINV